jgi:hypothetical protein
VATVRAAAAAMRRVCMLRFLAGAEDFVATDNFIAAEAVLA